MLPRALQVMLRWGLEHNVTVIPYSSTRAHIEQNLLAHSVPLSPADITDLTNSQRPAGWASFAFNAPDRAGAGSFECESASALVLRHETALDALARAAAHDARNAHSASAATSSAQTMAQTPRTLVLDAGTWPVEGVCAMDSADTARTLGALLAVLHTPPQHHHRLSATRW